MLIQNVRRTDNNKSSSITASITYEQRNVDTQDISFTIPANYSSMLNCSYESFLLISFSAALFHREKRIHIEGPCCPVLMNNLRAALRLQRKWFQPTNSLPLISASEERVQEFDPPNRETGAFFSGGIDSTAALISHAQMFGTKHPNSIKYAFLAHGLDIGDPNRKPEHELFEHALQTQRAVTSELGIEMVPLWTNARSLEPNGHLYESCQFAAILSGIAHSLSQGIKNVYMAYNNIVDLYIWWGDNPMLVPLLSSTYLTFSGQLLHLTRLEKLAIIAQSETALCNLRVCWNTNVIPTGYLNCGECEKCLRTKLELLAIGVSDMGKIFPTSRINVDQLRSLSAHRYPAKEFYDELIEPLYERGFHEYSNIIRLITGEPTAELWPSYAKMLAKRKYWKLSSSLQRSLKINKR